MSKTKLPERFGVLSSHFLLHLEARPQNPVQLSFPFIEPVGRLAVVDMETISYRAFMSFLHEQTPQYIFDIRPVPSFDLGRLSRRKVFEIFKEINASYRDLAGAFGLRAVQDVAEAASDLAERIHSTVEESPLRPSRLALLVDGSHSGRWARMHLSRALGPAVWNVQELDS